MALKTSIQVEYKQSKEHENELPDKFFKILQVTDLITTRYNNSLPKTDKHDEFMKRPIRHAFSIFARETKEDRLASVHLYLFDDETVAKKEYKKAMSNWIDEQIEPYRKLVAKGKTLTPFQIEKCKEIQALLPED